ncbi:MAG: hypothetical protein K2M00_06130 [Muribaculaceae bacterium]|nr:hypothetical protein [Muribaculaceae bacterium]
MNKLMLLLILPVLSFILSGCNNDDDIKPMNIDLMAGEWEVVNQGDQDVFERGCMLSISVSPDLIKGNYGGYKGSITTYYLTVSGAVLHDKVYGWNIRYVENQLPLLEVVLQGELDSEDIWEGDYHYKITKLTDGHMWWQVNSNGDQSTIKFRRRIDNSTD